MRSEESCAAIAFLYGVAACFLTPCIINHWVDISDASTLFVGLGSGLIVGAIKYETLTSETFLDISKRHHKKD